MNQEDIKKLAIQGEVDDLKTLSQKLIDLKNENVSFLGCVAFIQANQNLSLKDARALIMKMAVYSEDEKRHINNMNSIMLSEFEEE